MSQKIVITSGFFNPLHIGHINLIREAKVPQMYSTIQTGQALGMQTLDQCLTKLLKNLRK